MQLKTVLKLRSPSRALSGGCDPLTRSRLCVCECAQQDWETTGEFQPTRSPLALGDRAHMANLMTIPTSWRSIPQSGSSKPLSGTHQPNATYEPRHGDRLCAVTIGLRNSRALSPKHQTASMKFQPSLDGFSTTSSLRRETSSQFHCFFAFKQQHRRHL